MRLGPLRPVWRGLRFFGLWLLPPLVLAVALALGFAWWCFSSQAGTRWLLKTVAVQFDGHVQGVHGSLARGVTVDDVGLALPQADVRVAGLHLKVLWSALRDLRLHVSDLSALRVDAAVRTGPPSAEPSPPFHMPALPVRIRVDRFFVGGLDLRIDGAALPLDILSLSTALTLDEQGATLSLNDLEAARGDLLLSLQGHATLRRLAAPWPFEADIHATAQGLGPDSPVCVRQWPNQPVQAGTPCRIQLQAGAAGTLEDVRLQAGATGEGVQLALKTRLHPEQAFPLGETQLDLQLPGAAGLQLAVTPQPPASDGTRVIQASLRARQLQLTPWLPKGLGATLLNLNASLQAGLTATQQLASLGLRVDLDGPNRWNGMPLSGHAHLAHLSRAQGVLFDPGHAASWDPLGLAASGLDVALTLGSGRISAKGDFSPAAAQLAVQARLPALRVLWPDLPGGATVALAAHGTLADHGAELKLQYVPDHSRPHVPGRAPLALDVAASGGWTAAQGWKGRVSRLDLRHAGLEVRSSGAIPVAVAAPDTWQVGAATLAVTLDGQPLLQLQQQAAGGSPGQWASRGGIPSLVISPERILKLQTWLGQASAAAGGVRTALSDQALKSRLEARLTWDLKFKNALSGDIKLVRTGGDLTVPGDVPVTLGLQTASVDLALQPTTGATSIVRADAQIRTAKMGSLRIQADMPVHATPAGGIIVRPNDVKHVRIVADSDDLAWVNLLVDESVEVGGTVRADIQGQSHPDGSWTFTGPLSARDLSILSVDQGVRLLQGTLQGHLAGSQVVLDSLRFPAVRRVTPKEWRTATWISENPDAQGGSLDISGNWDLYQERGKVNIGFRRYPILQRADRYAMVTGNLAIEATLPQVSLSGKITADAGWFDLDMLNNIPSLDSDVVVLKPGARAAPPTATPLDLSVDLSLDLGPRFYLTGYGVNSGLVGDLNLRMRKGKLTALGALRTRGGSIDVYGQHLQLRRGTVTFQGDIANPVLSIEALRTDVAVQAGVRVAGTARHPRIDLVSHPDVSETEKLTWLILGHGPDEGGGGDVSLLFSVGSSFLSGGEPFYKRFGLDELSMRSGELGSTGSVLPVQSVVTDLDTGASPAEQRFVVASKTITDKLRVSLEQALAQTGTVARLSYRILRRLQAEATVGTVNGLALVYRWFSMD